MKWICDLIFGGRIERETERYLEQLAQAPVPASRENAARLLAKLRAEPGPKVTLGQTLWGEPVEVPLEEILKGHGLITGATGAGKTAACLLLVKSVDHILMGLKETIRLGASYFLAQKCRVNPPVFIAVPSALVRGRTALSPSARAKT